MAILCSLLALLCAVDASAQEAPAPENEPAAPGWVIVVEDTTPATDATTTTDPETTAEAVPTPTAALVPVPMAPVPAPAVLPPFPVPAPAAAAPPADDGEALSHATQHRNRRIKREQARLLDAIAHEGTEYSRAKELAYTTRFVFGFVLTIAGGVCLAAGILGGMIKMIELVIEDEILPPGAALGPFLGGVLGLTIGIPLIVSGHRGRRRQESLKTKDDTLTPFAPTTAPVSVSFFADPDRGAGGLRLNVSF